MQLKLGKMQKLNITANLRGTKNMSAENGFLTKPSQVITNSFMNTEYNLYLHGAIGEADEMMEHYSVYHSAGPQDLIRLWLVSPGGDLATGSEYAAHMEECKAPIIGIVGMGTASMATALAMKCDDLEISDMSTFLVHGFSYGTGGTESSVYNQAVFNKKLNERWVRNTYTGFLTEQEIVDTLRGVDILIDSEDLQKRWDLFKEYRGNQPCNCGSPDCAQNQRLAAEAQGDDFKDIEDFDLEALIAEKVAEGIALHEKKKLAGEKKASKPKPVKSVEKTE
jgi:ATP-dependent protease ClpP protease subunit